MAFCRLEVVSTRFGLLVTPGGGGCCAPTDTSDVVAIAATAPAGAEASAVTDARPAGALVLVAVDVLASNAAAVTAVVSAPG